MSWVEGEPLLKRGEATLPPSELPLVRFGIGTCAHRPTPPRKPARWLSSPAESIRHDEAASAAARSAFTRRSRSLADAFLDLTGST
jgi:hypothetical protein